MVSVVSALDGLLQIVLISGDRVISLATDGSRERWNPPWEAMNGINAALPLPDRVLGAPTTATAPR